MDISTTQSCSFHMLTQGKKKRTLSRQYQHVILIEHYTGCCIQFLPRREIKVTGVGIPCRRTAEKPQRVFLYSWQGLKDSAYWLWHSSYMCTHSSTGSRLSPSVLEYQNNVCISLENPQLLSHRGHSDKP